MTISRSFLRRIRFDFTLRTFPVVDALQIHSNAIEDILEINVQIQMQIDYPVHQRKVDPGMREAPKPAHMAVGRTMFVGRMSN